MCVFVAPEPLAEHQGARILRAGDASGSGRGCASPLLPLLQHHMKTQVLTIIATVV
jgi:hypothetical protein